MEKNIRKVVNAWSSWGNPLTGMTQWQVKRMINSLKYGNDIRLQIAFFDIERLCPLFGICIDKRQAGVLKRKWRIVPVDDTQAAKSQAEEVQKIFQRADARNRDGLT